MQSKVITNDTGARQEFKEKVFNRLNELMTGTTEEQDEQSPVVEVIVPSNYYKLSGPELYGIFQKQQLTPEQVGYVIAQLRGEVQASPEFKLVLEWAHPEEEVVSVRTVKEFPELEVSLPEGFESLKIKDQFLVLRHEFKFTPEQANDIIAVLSGQPPQNFKLIIKEKEPISLPELERTFQDLRVQLPAGFKDLEPYNQLTYLKNVKRLTVKQANDIMLTLNDKLPLHFNVAIEYLPVPQKVETVPVKKVEFPTLEVSLPEGFETLKAKDQFLALRHDCKLTPEQANDVVAYLTGQSPQNFKLIIKEKESISLPELERTFQDLKVTLPAGFKDLEPSTQLTYLKNEKRLTTKQANDVLSALNSKSPLYFKVSIEYMSVPQKVETVSVKEVEFPTLEVNLPEGFEKLKAKDQFFALVQEFKFTSEQANDVVAYLSGQSPQNFKLVINKEDSIPLPELEKTFQDLKVTLPANFKELEPGNQLTYLKNEKRLTVKQANDVMFALNGKPPLYFKVEVEFLPVPEKAETIPIKETEFPTIEVSLPEGFERLRYNDQFLWLKTQLDLTIEQANDVLFALQGKVPLQFKIIIK